MISSPETKHQKLLSFLVQFSLAQCMATLFSLPFLVGWGIPLSIMACVGNLIFTPILMVFISLSALLFFTELLSIPNGFILNMLDAVFYCWKYLLTLGSKQWLFGFCRPHFLFLLSIPLFTLLALATNKHHEHLKRLIILTACCTVSIFFLGSYSNLRQLVCPEKQIKCDEKLTFLRDKQGILSIIDNGAFSLRMNIKSRVEYNVQPMLMSTFGTTHINRYVINRPTAASFKALQALLTKCNVDAVHLIYFDTELSKQDWYFFFEMKRQLESENIELVRFEKT